MIETPSVDWFALSPELAMLAAAGVALLGAVLLPRHWIRSDRGLRVRSASRGICRGGAPLLENGTPSLEVADAISRDRLAAFAQMIVAGSGLLAVGISYSSRRRVEHVGEYYALLATCGGGMAFLVSASNLMTLFLGLEWFSVWLYVLCAMDLDRSHRSRPGSST